MNILAISGSLRGRSYNTTLLRAAARIDPAVTVFDGIGALPLFNPDLDDAGLAPVERWRAALGAADALIIASPEYAHGISGVMKNALDWAVSMENFPGKPVALVNTTPRAVHAQAALREVLATMSARLLEPSPVDLPLQGSGLDLDGVLARPDLVASLQQLLGMVRRAVE